MCRNRFSSQTRLRNGIPRSKLMKTGNRRPGCLPGGDAIFQRLGELLVHELQREAFLEVPHDASLHLTEQDKGVEGWADFRGDGGARLRHVDDAAAHLAAVLEREDGNRVAR